MAHAKTNLTQDQEEYVESHAPYIKVFLVLLVFTLIEYFYAMFFSGGVLHARPRLDDLRGHQGADWWAGTSCT